MKGTILFMLVWGLLVMGSCKFNMDVKEPIMNKTKKELEKEIADKYHAKFVKIQTNTHNSFEEPEYNLILNVMNPQVDYKNDSILNTLYQDLAKNTLSQVQNRDVFTNLIIKIMIGENKKFISQERTFRVSEF